MKIFEVRVKNARVDENQDFDDRDLVFTSGYRNLNELSQGEQEFIKGALQGHRSFLGLAFLFENTFKRLKSALKTKKYKQQKVAEIPEPLTH